MVEMLGVLAIIGVLSVGAIAGYSKAMTKYKLNKQSEQLTQLVTALYKYKAQWKFDGSKIVDLIPYYEKLGEIPTEMLNNASSDSNGRIIYDVFRSAIQMRTNGTWSMGHEVLLTYQVKGNNSFDVCQNLVNIGKSLRENILYVGVAKTASGSSSNTFDTKYFGDAYCKQAIEDNLGKCMNDITMQTISQQRKFCDDSDGCVFRFQFITD